MQDTKDLLKNIEELSAKAETQPVSDVGKTEVELQPQRIDWSDESSYDLGVRVGRNAVDFITGEALPEILSREEVYDLADSCRGEDGKVDVDRFCDGLEAKVHANEDARVAKEEYFEAKQEYYSVKREYSSSNMLVSFQRLDYDLAAYKAGMKGADGKIPNKWDIVADVIRCLKGDLTKSLIEVCIKDYFDAKVTRPEMTERVDRPEGGYSPKEVFRENGSIAPGATKEEIQAAAKEIDAKGKYNANYCGADMRVEPRQIGKISVWNTGRPVERISTIVNGEISQITVPSMRIADVSGNKYLVDPFGKAVPIDIERPTIRLKEDVDGNAYIRQLDRSLIKGEAEKLDAYAAAEGKSVVTVKQEFADKSADSYIKGSVDRIETHRNVLADEVISAKDRIEGYNEQLAKIDKAIDAAKEKLASLDNREGAAEKRADLTAKIERLEAAGDSLEKAKASAQEKIDKCEATIERYNKALKDIDASESRSEKLVATTKAEIDSSGRGVEKEELSKEEVESVSKAIEEAVDVETESVDIDQHESEEAVVVEEKDSIADEISETQTTEADQNDVAPLESEKENDRETVLTEAQVEKKEVSDVLSEKMSIIEKADKEIKVIREEKMPELDAKIEAAKERLELNIAARDEYVRSGEDYGEGVLEALNESVEDSKAELDNLVDEKSDLEAKVEGLEKESAEANDVVSFVEKNFENDAKIEIDSDGNVVATKIDEEGNLVSKEAISQDTGLPVEVNLQEEALTAAIDSEDLLQDIDLPNNDDVDNGFETDLDKIDRTDGDLARIEAEVSNDTRESQVEKPLENAIDNEPKDQAANDDREKAVAAENQQDTAKDPKDTATNDQKQETTKEQKDDPAKDQSEAKVEEDKQDIEKNLEQDANDIVSAPEEDVSTISDVEPQAEDVAITTDEEDVSGLNGEDDLDTEDLDSHEVEENSKTETEDDDDADVVADATEKLRDRIQDSSENSAIENEQSSVIEEDPSTQNKDGEHTSDISQADIEEAMNKYIDQGPDGDYSFSSDFLSNTDVSAEQALDALNNVITERNDDDSSNEQSNTKFSDILSDIVDKEIDSVKGKIDDLVNLFDDIASGNWEAVGRDILDMALSQSDLAPFKDQIMDYLFKDFDSGNEAVDIDKSENVSADEHLEQMEADCADYDTYTDVANDMTEQDFSSIDTSPDVSPESDVDIPSDNLTDFANEDFNDDFGNDIDSNDMDAMDGMEGSVESEGGEAVEEIIAALL